jgi:hypothetical protein
MKADVEMAKQKIEEQSNDNQNDDGLVESCDQPDWMELIHPCKQFEDLADFCYDDGGPELTIHLIRKDFPEPSVPDTIILKGSNSSIFSI